MTLENKRYDVAVIGGGLSGLTAAIYAAKAGKSVVIIEKSGNLGGHAQTTKMDGAFFNFGPHAMYESGGAMQILKELDCIPRGGYASKGGMVGIYQREMIHMPSDLSANERREWGQIMGGLVNVDTDSIRLMSIQEWADANIVHDRVKLFFLAMCKQWSYSDNPSMISAGYVIKQGQLAADGVRYVEGGWQEAVKQLHNLADQLGIAFITGKKAQKILLNNGTVSGVFLSEDFSVESKAVITALGPNEVCKLVEGSEQMSLGRWRDESYPIYAACLDVALNKLPHPERAFALGLDEPFYFGIHSLSVKLSENGAHVLHVLKYQDDQVHPNAKEDKQQLLDVLSLLQPGWENEVLAIRFLPNILVAHDAHTINHAGAGSSPYPKVPEVNGLHVAGDWVGQEGRLADAAMLSARLAAWEVIRES